MRLPSNFRPPWRTSDAFVSFFLGSIIVSSEGFSFPSFFFFSLTIFSLYEDNNYTKIFTKISLLWLLGSYFISSLGFYSVWLEISCICVCGSCNYPAWIMLIAIDLLSVTHRLFSIWKFPAWNSNSIAFCTATVFGHQMPLRIQRFIAETLSRLLLLFKWKKKKERDLWSFCRHNIITSTNERFKIQNTWRKKFKLSRKSAVSSFRATSTAVEI